MAFSSPNQELLFYHIEKCFDSQWNQSILKSSPYISAEAAVPLYLDSSLLIKRAKLSNSGAGCLGFRSNSRLTRPERRTASNCSFVVGSFLAVSRRAATKIFTQNHVEHDCKDLSQGFLGLVLPSLPPPLCLIMFNQINC